MSHHPPPVGPRRVLECAALFLALALAVRTLMVEPFAVPTGSMAPTLLGRHWEAACPDCGFRVLRGDPGEDDAGDPASFIRAGECPHCGASMAACEPTLLPGDRVVVDKTVYEWRDPWRWDAAVFAGTDSPRPFVKRVVGLPGESVTIREGDVWADGRLLRKPPALAWALAVPVHDAACRPAAGWGDWWAIEAGTGSVELRHDGSLELTAGPTPGDGASAVWRDWDRGRGLERAVRDRDEYNALFPTPTPRRRPRFPAARDFLAEACLTPRGPVVAELALSDGADRVSLRLTFGSGRASASAELLVDGVPRRARSLPRWPAGDARRVRLSLVDRRAWAEVDGVALGPIDLPDPAPGRPDVSRPLRLTAHAGAAGVSGLRLLRDLVYADRGTTALGAAVRLGPGEYFVLGDNSANSDDSRFWKNPGVPRANFLGKPIFRHQPSRAKRGGAAATDWSRVGRVP